MTTKTETRNQICVRNITQFNEKWFTLPVNQEELSKFLHNDNDEYIIIDYVLPFEVSEYEHIPTLNENFNKLVESEVDLEIVKILFEVSTLSNDETLKRIIDHDFIIEQIDDNKSIKVIDESDVAFYLYDNALISFLGEISDDLIDFIDWDRVWRDCELCHNWKMYFDSSSCITYAIKI